LHYHSVLLVLLLTEQNEYEVDGESQDTNLVVIGLAAGKQHEALLNTSACCLARVFENRTVKEQ